MPFIKRTKEVKSAPRTKNELKLFALRDTLNKWQSVGMGLDYPATSATRLKIGQDIRTIKKGLVDSGLYKLAVNG